MARKFSAHPLTLRHQSTLEHTPSPGKSLLSYRRALPEASPGSGPRPLPATHSEAKLVEEIFELTCQHMRKIAGLHAPDFEDLVQAASERAVREVSKFEGRSSLSTWVFRVCYSVFLTDRRWYRRWYRRFTLSESGELPEMNASTSEAPELIEVGERNLRLRSAVDRLAPKLRTVVVLHDLEGLSVAEVSELLGAKELTIRSRLRDGRNNLRRKLAKDPYFGEFACEAEGGT
ncbi:MAG: RNA polymerase sigma factor [Polyangiaceae bacterium]|nr:RNA polymerase sigma factor [Polyangiaceae bacterium]